MFVMFRRERKRIARSVPAGGRRKDCDEHRIVRIRDLMQSFPFQPEQASTIARSVDHLYYFLTAVTLFFTALIFSIIFYFMIRYRRRSPDERPKAIEGRCRWKCCGPPSPR